jgi:hypothetical protein
LDENNIFAETIQGTSRKRLDIAKSQGANIYGCQPSPKIFNLNVIIIREDPQGIQ